MAAGVTISKEKWDKLAPAEKELAKKMGFLPPKNPGLSTQSAERKPKSKQLKQYILGIVTECTLCKELQINYYEMKRREKSTETYLESIEVFKSTTPNKWEVRKTSCCKMCKSNLKFWSKEALINKTLAMAIRTKPYKLGEESSNGSGEADKCCKDNSSRAGEASRSRERH